MSELKPRITENGIDYILVGDYYIPGLKLPEEHRPIGKYGRMHREYLREVHPARLNTLILTGELLTYLADLNEQAQKRLDTIMEQMKATEGVTEELKCTRQMEWVQRCNNIHNRAEEIVLYEFRHFVPSRRLPGRYPQVQLTWQMLPRIWQRALPSRQVP